MAQWDSLGRGSVDWGTIGPWKKGLGRKRTIDSSRKKKGGDYSSNGGRTIKDTTLEVEPSIELVEEEVKTTNLEVGIKPLVAEQIEITQIVVEQLET